jgi:hypothetical protein
LYYCVQGFIIWGEFTMTKITDKISTGQDWCTSNCIIIEGKESVLFSTPVMGRWKHGTATAHIDFSLEEAKALQIDLASKIQQYEHLNVSLTEWAQGEDNE